MQITAKPTFHVIVKVAGRTVRSYAVFPDGSQMVAASPKTLRTGLGPVETYRPVENDIMIGSSRYRFTGIQGKDYVVVPWEEGMDD